MSIIKQVKNLFSRKSDFVPIFSQQAAFLCQTSETMVNMLKTLDRDEWEKSVREVKMCEVQGDALLTEFHEQLSEHLISPISKMDLQTIAMSMDDCLDVIKDSTKAILIYLPKKIDPQLQDLANLVKSEADALKRMLPLLSNIKNNFTAISLQCDRVAELEHAADDGYEDYIGYIFLHEDDTRELIKYKNMAEMFENATDHEKHVSDVVRKILTKYISEA
jgi:uncharacterized protein Yka (UPF0111/DUF47 family)